MFMKDSTYGPSLEEKLRFINKRNYWTDFLKNELRGDGQERCELLIRIDDYLQIDGISDRERQKMNKFWDESLDLQTAVEIKLNPASGYGLLDKIHEYLKHDFDFKAHDLFQNRLTLKNGARAGACFGMLLGFAGWAYATRIGSQYAAIHPLRALVEDLAFSTMFATVGGAYFGWIGSWVPKVANPPA